MITHRLDLLTGPTNVTEGWKTVDLPISPAPREALKLDGELLQILARGYEITDGALTVGLLVARNGSIVMADAGMLKQLTGAAPQ